MQNKVRKRKKYMNRMEEGKTLYQKADNELYNMQYNRHRSVQLVVCSSTLLNSAGCLFNVLKNKRFLYFR